MKDPANTTARLKEVFSSIRESKDILINIDVGARVCIKRLKIISLTKYCLNIFETKDISVLKQSTIL